MATIVLDPGHGGSQTIQGDSTWNNAVGPNGTLEKNLVLDVGMRAAAVLTAAGHDVRMTRTTDTNLRLADRAKVARNAQAQAFVSVHFNGSVGHTAQGTETLVHTNFSQASARLSLAVQDALLPVTGLTDRNRAFNQTTRIKPQALGVLRPDRHYPSTAACLLEVSFLDRTDEEQRLQDHAYLQAIGQALADGIEAYTGQAIAAAPLVPLDAGDAIEIAAIEASGTPDAVALLGLDAVAAALAGQADASMDPEESIAVPKGAFAKSFLLASGPPLSLLAGQPAWPELPDFVEFIESLDLAHFAPDEFLELGASNKSGPCKGLNAFPPRNLWPSLANTALMVDAIRKELGVAIRILSAYRSPDYNACVGGGSGSAHLRFNAVDFTCREGTPEVWRRVAAGLRDS